MSDRKKVLTAIALSLLLHVLLFCFLVVWALVCILNRCRRCPRAAPGGGGDHHDPSEAHSASFGKGGRRGRVETGASHDRYHAELQTTEKPPEQAEFESDKNSRAASELPATGLAPLPSQEGREDLKHLDFKNQNLALGKGRQPEMQIASAPKPPQPQPEPVTRVEKPHPQPTPPPESRTTPSPTQEMAKLSDNLFALQKPTPAGRPARPMPTPRQAVSAVVPPQPPRQPPQPKSEPGFQPQKMQGKIAGSISNRGKSGVNARGTPLGRYQKIVADSVQSRWYYYIQQHMDLLRVGEAHIKFAVKTDGRVDDVEVASNTANEMFGMDCVQSITKAELPPIPPDVASLLDDGRLEIEFTFILYPN